MPKNKKSSRVKANNRGKSRTAIRPQLPLVKSSYEELLSFLRYYRHFGTPTIIGGWAVYFYNPYYGSVDIDVVGPSLRGAFYETIERYERSHGYVITQNDPLGIEVMASKPIFTKKSKKKRKIGDMEIDACSYEQTGASAFHEDPSKLLPYYLCDREPNRRLVSLARNCVCYAPSRDLLVLYKVKARRDRTYDVRTRGATMDPSRLEWLRGKIVKDGSDIIALLDDPRGSETILNEPWDAEHLAGIASEFRITDLAKETLREVLNNRPSLELYGRSIDVKTIRESIRKAL